jgi:four helix bundle protein
MNLQSGNPANRDSQGREQYSYRNLDVWKEAQDIAVEVIRLTERLPQKPAAVSITRQIVDAAGSVGANIAEGHARFTIPAYRNPLSIAKGSACEVDSWLDLLRRLEYISPEAEDVLHVRISSLVRILIAKMRALEAKLPKKEPRIREDFAVYSASADAEDPYDSEALSDEDLPDEGLPD